jgi:hypothetical protein
MGTGAISFAEANAAFASELCVSQSFARAVAKTAPVPISCALRAIE